MTKWKKSYLEHDKIRIVTLCRCRCLRRYSFGSNFITGYFDHFIFLVANKQYPTCWQIPLLLPPSGTPMASILLKLWMILSVVDTSLFESDTNCDHHPIFIWLWSLDSPSQFGGLVKLRCNQHARSKWSYHTVVQSSPLRGAQMREMPAWSHIFVNKWNCLSKFVYFSNFKCCF